MQHRADHVLERAVSLIPEWSRDLETVAVAVVTRQGIVQDVNRGFSRLLPHHASAERRMNARDLFIHPRFDRLVAQPDHEGGVVYRGVLTLSDARGGVRLLQGSLRAVDDQLLMFAEHEVGTLDALRAKITELTEELAEKERELARLNRQLQHQQALAEAALKDREILFEALSRDSDRST